MIEYKDHRRRKVRVISAQLLWRIRYTWRSAPEPSDNLEVVCLSFLNSTYQFARGNRSKSHCVRPMDHKSIEPRSFLIPSTSMPPPSGSAASIHRTTAIVCFGALVLTQTRPFIPTAVSKGKVQPRIGRRKWLGSSNLEIEGRRKKSEIWTQFCVTYCLHMPRLQRIMNPPFSSPNPSAFLVCASKHSISGSISLWASETRA